MRFMRRAPLWLAAVLALIAIGDLCAFVQGENPENDYLFDATIASVLGAASLVTGVCLVSLEARAEFESAAGRPLRHLVGRMLRRSKDNGHHPERRRAC